LLNDLFKKNEYSYKSLVPIARAQNDQSVFWVAKNSKYKTMQDVIDFAKQNPDRLSFGMVGSQGIDMVVIEQWAQLTDVRVIPVPLANGSEMMAALVGGHIDICHEEPGAAMAMFEAGEIRPLLVMTEDRLDRFPDTPTAREMGADVTVGNWRGVFVKEGTPHEIVTKLQDTFKEGLQDPRYKEFEREQLLDLREGYLSSEDFRVFIDEQYVLFENILKNIGLIK
jgi:tripartite-type tricarboxylate transporter receptor subunit TctC